MFAEIILPLPLYATYTYAVPSRLEGMLQAGSRVLVQFGKKKYYTGLVETLHNNSPKGRGGEGDHRTSRRGANRALSSAESVEVDFGILSVFGRRGDARRPTLGAEA